MKETGYGLEGRQAPAYRSKGEVQVARLLDREGIAFQYEHPLAVMDRGRVRIWYPDFWLCEYGMIVEYFGRNSDPEYRKRTDHKMEVYRQNGIEGVFLTEASFAGDWPTRITGAIENILVARVNRFHRPGRRNYAACESTYRCNSQPSMPEEIVAPTWR